MALAIMLTSSVALAQDVVEIPFAPGANTTWRVEETRVRTNSQDTSRNRSGVVRSTLRIGAANEEGFAASWTTDEVRAGGEVERGETLPQFVGTPLAIELDFAGAPSRIDDWPGTLRRIMAAVAELTDAEDPAALAAVERMMAAWTPAQAAQVLLQTASMMSICQHTGLAIGEPAEGETVVANPFGGEGISAIERFELLSVDRAANTARLRYSRSLEPESATRAIMTGLRNMARESGNPAEEQFAQMEGMTLTHDTSAECAVDLRTGVTRSISHDTRVSIGDIIQTDRREISVQRSE